MSIKKNNEITAWSSGELIKMDSPTSLPKDVKKIDPSQPPLPKDGIFDKNPGYITNIDMLRTGKFIHPKWGVMTIDEEMLDNMIKNFKDGVVDRDISFDLNHDPSRGSYGWLRDVYKEPRMIKGHPQIALVGKTEFTPDGAKFVSDRAYSYFSIEFHRNYNQREVFNTTLDEDGNEIPCDDIVNYGPTIIGGALTNRPFIPNMEKVQFSELPENVEYLIETEDNENSSSLSGSDLISSNSNGGKKIKIRTQNTKKDEFIKKRKGNLMKDKKKEKVVKNLIPVPPTDLPEKEPDEDDKSKNGDATKVYDDDMNDKKVAASIGKPEGSPVVDKPASKKDRPADLIPGTSMSETELPKERSMKFGTMGKLITFMETRLKTLAPDSVEFAEVSSNLAEAKAEVEMASKKISRSEKALKLSEERATQLQVQMDNTAKKLVSVESKLEDHTAELTVQRERARQAEIRNFCDSLMNSGHAKPVIDTVKEILLEDKSGGTPVITFSEGESKGTKLNLQGVITKILSSVPQDQRVDFSQSFKNNAKKSADDKSSSDKDGNDKFADDFSDAIKSGISKGTKGFKQIKKSQDAKAN